MKMTGAEMVLAAFEEENVEVVFGFPGGAVLTLYDEIYKKGLNHILTRHEQGAAHAADGYARATGKPGVVIATSGPGATNLVTGIATAYMDSVPLVAITGQVARPAIGTDAFQEADITGITMPITKHNYLVKDIRELPRMLKKAFYIANTGRKGPVLIDLPKDLQVENGEFNYPQHVEIAGYKPTYEGHPRQISKAVQALRRASRPLLYAGGGVISSGAHRELLELSQQACIPITTTLTGLGSIPHDYELFLGMPGMHGTYAANHALHECDLLLAVGTRFDDRVTGKLDTFVPKAKIVHLDIDPAEISKNIVVDIPIVGDVKLTLEQILKRLTPGDTREWCQRVQEWKDSHPLRYCKDQEECLKPQFVIEELYRVTRDKGPFLTTDVGQHQMWATHYFRVNRPRSFVSSGGLGTMGFGLPAALGVQAAHPNELVLCIAGDGSFQMNSQELATAVYYNLPVKIAIINNSCLGMVRQWQKFFYEGRYSHTSMAGSPDFVKLAEAYGAAGIRVSSADQVAPAVQQALNINGPVLIDFQVDPEENVLPMVAPNTSIVEMIGGE